MINYFDRLPDIPVFYCNHSASQFFYGFIVMMIGALIFGFASGWIIDKCQTRHKE